MVSLINLSEKIMYNSQRWNSQKKNSNTLPTKLIGAQ